MFPQHGSGAKHERPIVLEHWQRAITFEYPEALIRGLIQSDGCRFVARQRSQGGVRAYPRYAFSNRSGDILGIFCDHLDLLEIDWTQSNWYAIQIARRDAVAKLDKFVGPKR